MAFSVNDRVRVSSDNSQWRGKFGTVLSAGAGDNQVRLDGFPDSRPVLLKDAELQTTTQPNPITQ